GFFFFSSRRRHTRFSRDWSSDVCSSDLEEHTFYAQYNKIDKIKHVVLAYEDDTPLGCGAIKEFESGTMEVKRMYVLPDGRGKGRSEERRVGKECRSRRSTEQ